MVSGGPTGVTMKRSLSLFVAVVATFSIAVSSMTAQETGKPADKPGSGGVSTSAPATPSDDLMSVDADSVGKSDLKLMEYFGEVPEPTGAILSAASDMANAGKWATAFNSLQTYDPENLDPYVLSLKARMAMAGHLQTYMHILFNFADLGEDQSLDDLRGSGVEGAEPIELNVPVLAQTIEEKGVEIPAVLSMVLGDYYSEILDLYAGQWMESDEEVAVKALENYEKAMVGGITDPRMSLKQAQLLSRTGNNEAAIAAYRAYLDKNPDDCVVGLEYVKSLSAAGKTEETFKEIDAMIMTEVDPEHRNELFMLGVQTSVDAGDSIMTEKYLNAMQADNPSDTVPDLIRHLLAIRAQDEDKAGTLADKLLASSKGDPNVVRSLVSSWVSENASGKAMDFLDRGILAFPDSHEVLSALLFYKSLLVAEVATGPEDMGKALEWLVKAEAEFVAFLPPESPVFATIADLKTKMTEAMAPVEEEAESVTEPNAPAPGAPAASPDAPVTDPAKPAGQTEAPATGTYAAASGDADATSAATE